MIVRSGGVKPIARACILSLDENHGRSCRDPACARRAQFDRRGATEYYHLALGAACQRLVTLGDWRTVHQYCDDLPTVDAHYFRTMFELLSGSLTNRDLMRTITLRGDEQLILASAIDGSGRHIDALIVALLERFRDDVEAQQYLDLCTPWSDVFFDRSRLRF